MKFKFTSYTVRNYEEYDHHIFLEKDFNSLEDAINHLNIKDTINHKDIEIAESWKDVKGNHANILISEYKINNYIVVGNWIRID
jgi:hypothetical protein